MSATIESVIAQQYDAIEYIVIDGASSDGTLRLIEHYKQYLSYVISEPDHGIYDAMNKAIGVASGEWILFLNAGDTFAQVDVLRRFVAEVDAQTDIYAAAVNWMSFDGAVMECRKPNGLDLIWKQTPCWHQGTLVRTGLMRLLGFSTCYRISADYEFFVRAYKASARFQFVDWPLACMLEGGLHVRWHDLTVVEGLHIVAVHAPDTNEIYRSNFMRQLGASPHYEDGVRKATTVSRFCAELLRFEQDYHRLALYGYGDLGRVVHGYLEGRVVVVADRFKAGQRCHNGDEIVAPEALLEYDVDAVLICVLGQYTSIAEYLTRRCGIQEQKLIALLGTQ